MNDDHNCINEYFDGIRKAFNVKGILVWNESSVHRIRIIGFPYIWVKPVNDNEVKF